MCDGRKKCPANMADAGEPELWTRFFEVPESSMLHRDELVVAFLDRDPKAATHIQVVPRHQYIKGVEALRVEHRPLLEHMRKVGQELTQCQPRFMGFHQFPHRSVPHLHLHCLVEPFKSRSMKRFAFTANKILPQFGFVELQTVLDRPNMQEQ